VVFSNYSIKSSPPTLTLPLKKGEGTIAPSPLGGEGWGEGIND